MRLSPHASPHNSMLKEIACLRLVAARTGLLAPGHAAARFVPLPKQVTELAIYRKKDTEVSWKMNKSLVCPESPVCHPVEVRSLVRNWPSYCDGGTMQDHSQLK